MTLLTPKIYIQNSFISFQILYYSLRAILNKWCLKRSLVNNYIGKGQKLDQTGSTLSSLTNFTFTFYTHTPFRHLSSADKRCMYTIVTLSNI